MRNHFLPFLSGAALLALAACSSTSDEPAAAPPTAEHKAITTEKLEPYECGTMTRLHTYGGIFLGSQPQAADIEQAKKGGIVTVVNLRHKSEIPDFDESALVADLGLKYVNIAWNGPDELDDAVFDRMRQVFNEEQRPMLVHCSSANRVGAVWLPWRVLDGGVPFEQALAEAKLVGMKTPAYETKARDYIERHRRAGS